MPSFSFPTIVTWLYLVAYAIQCFGTGLRTNAELLSPGKVTAFPRSGNPNQNACIERFNRSYRTEVLDTYQFTSGEEVREIAWNWMLECNEERAPDQLTKVVFDPLLVDLDIFAERLLTILSLGGGLLCGSLDLDNPTSPHEPPLLQNVRKKRYVIS